MIDLLDTIFPEIDDKLEKRKFLDEALIRFDVNESDIINFVKGCVDIDKINVALAADYLKVYTELSVRNFATKYLNKYYVFDNLKQYDNYTFFREVLDYFYTYEVKIEISAEEDTWMETSYFFNVPKKMNSREILDNVLEKTHNHRVSGYVAELLPLNIKHTANFNNKFDLERYIICYEGINTSIDKIIELMDLYSITDKHTMREFELSKLDTAYLLHTNPYAFRYYWNLPEHASGLHSAMMYIFAAGQIATV